MCMSDLQKIFKKTHKNSQIWTYNHFIRSSFKAFKSSGNQQQKQGMGWQSNMFVHLQQHFNHETLHARNSYSDCNCKTANQ